MQPVDGVAQGPADDQPERCGGESRRGPGQPCPKKRHRRHFEGQQRPLADRPLLGEQAVADAGVPGQDEVGKRRHRHGAATAEIEGVNEPKFCGLVERTGERRYDQPEGAQRPPNVAAVRVASCCVCHEAPYSAALRMSSHSRKAWASRGVTSGYCGSSPTAGEIFHERAHFLPSARRGSTATPRTSSSRNAAAGPSPSTRVAAEVMHSSARSAPTATPNKSVSET